MKKEVVKINGINNKPGTLVGYKDALSVLENYPRASVNIVDPAGHNVQHEQPELFRQNLIEWPNKIK